MVAFSIGADDVGVQDEGQPFESPFPLVFQFVTFIYAQPELVVGRSAAPYLDFAYPEKGLRVVVIFRKKGFQLFYGFR